MTQYEIVIRTDNLFAVHGGEELLGDLYHPRGVDKAPVLVAAHGGGWQIGDRKFYRHWGPYLAARGYALFSIEYRLMKPGRKTWPAAACDVKSAVQYVRANVAELGIDPDRIALIGDSAGAHLTSLVALAGEEPLLSSEHRDDSHAGVSAAVKACIGFYGVYDMAAQWEHDQIYRPRDQITEKFLGGPPSASRRVFFEASPMSYATIDKNSTKFLLIYGREDEIVDPVTQSDRFLIVLKQAGFFARNIVIPEAGHFWASDPVEEPGSFGARTAPRLLRFLEATL
ncbi:MAG TPA: alpha/beta hydrolase [Stellaceae bacterium]|nr:alpha/beta hydrolase [Stellaceae bacterium]